MISSYLRTSVRSIVHNQCSSAINIIGLATSMSVGLLLIAIVHDMHSYEKFHTKGNRIYRVITDYKESDGNTIHMATASFKAGELIREQVPAVEDLVILCHGFSGEFQFEDRTLSASGFWAEPTLFTVFSFSLLKGNPTTALKEPHSVVLTEVAAKKLFGDSDPIGKTVVKNNAPFLVTGVMQNIPQFSHLQFEAIGSLSTVVSMKKNDRDLFAWNNIWSNYIYVLLSEDGSPDNLQANLERLSESENGAIPDRSMELSLQLQPLEKIALGKRLENQMGPTLSSSMLWFLTGLAFIVLFSACFNYTNLSIARFLRRSREVGIRKVIGARTLHVFVQFILEATIISLAAFLLALLIFIFVRPQFLSLTPNIRHLLTLNITPRLVFYFIQLAILIGIIAGLLPAIFYMKVSAVDVIKKSSLRVNGRLPIRKVLTVVQYTFSIVFITSTLIIYKQYQHFLSFDLGFKTHNVLNIKLGEVDSELLAKELTEIPEITNISRSFMITSVGNNYYTYAKYRDTRDSIRVWYNKIDENYIPLFHLKLIAGKNFIERPGGTEEREVIVNEKLVHQFSIGGGNADKAIGESLIIEGKEMTVLGVVNDFHFNTVNKEIGPFVFRYATQDFQYINARVQPSNLRTLMAKIEKAWEKFDPAHPLDARFYDELIQRAYSEYSSMTKIVGFLALLAIIIASVGLLGMVVFLTESKLREVSIRKIFGAGHVSLILLLSRGFLLLLTLSGMVALPFTYLLFTKIILNDVAYHSPIGIVDLFSGAFAVMIIGLAIIGFQTWKRILVSPAEVLKNES